MKRLLDWRNWMCSGLEERHGERIAALEQRVREQNDAIFGLLSDLNHLHDQFNERQTPLPAGRRVARTFSEFRAAAEGRPQEKR